MHIKQFLGLSAQEGIPVYTVSTKKRPPLSMFKKTSKLASFAQLQFNSMNICLFSIELPILVKICPTVIEILTFNEGF